MSECQYYEFQAIDRPVQTNIPSKSANHKKCCARSA